MREQVLNGSGFVEVGERVGLIMAMDEDIWYWTPDEDDGDIHGPFLTFDAAADDAEAKL